MPSSSMVQANAKAKFDETLEAHVRLGIEKGRSELVFKSFLFSGNLMILYFAILFLIKDRILCIFNDYLLIICFDTTVLPGFFS